jgi:hypothetical protein
MWHLITVLSSCQSFTTLPVTGAPYWSYAVPTMLHWSHTGVPFKHWTPFLQPFTILPQHVHMSMLHNGTIVLCLTVLFRFFDAESCHQFSILLKPRHSCASTPVFSFWVVAVIRNGNWVGWESHSDDGLYIYIYIYIYMYIYIYINEGF